MSQPDRQQYIDNIQSDVAMSYFQSRGNFIAPQVFPAVPVNKQEAKYYIFAKNDFLRDEMQIRPNAGESAGGGYGLSSDSYICNCYALHKDITERDRKNWNNPNLSIEDATTQWLVQMFLQRLERQWVTDFFASSLGYTDTTGAASGNGSTTFTYWSTAATSDPCNDVDFAKTSILKATGFEPNTLVVGWEVWQKLKRHPLVVDRISGGATTDNPARVTPQVVAAILEVKNLYIAKAVKATNYELETAAYDFIAGKNALVCYVPDAPSTIEPSTGYTFMWDAAQSGTDPRTITIYSIEAPLLGAGTVRQEIEVFWDNKVTGTDLGFFFGGIVA